MRLVNLVNNNDEIIGTTDLLDAHLGNGKKHQAISLFLFHQKNNGQFELLLQQRSQEKIVGNLQWANTLCANLIPSESHVDCLKRRFFEELGVAWPTSWLAEEAFVFDYQVACENGFAENEIDHFFIQVIDDQEFSKLELKPNFKEVADLAWLDWELVKSKQFDQKSLTPWFNLFLDAPEIIQKIDQILCKK